MSNDEITPTQERRNYFSVKDATPGIAYYLNKIPWKMIPLDGILRLEEMDTLITNI